MTRAQEVGQLLNAKIKELFDIQKQHEVGFDPNLGVPLYKFPDGLEIEIEARSVEVAELTDKFKRLQEAERVEQTERRLAEMNQIERKHTSLARNGEGAYRLNESDFMNSFKSLGDSVTDHVGFKMRRERNNAFSIDLDELDFKILTTGGSPGIIPDNPRGDRVVPYPVRPLRVADLIPTTPTDQTQVVWLEETTFTNNASMTGEGYTKPESSLDYTERTSAVRKIAHVIRVTDEIMDDIPGFQALINNRMVNMLMLKEEQQILSGSGIGQEFTGILNHSSIQTQAYSVNNADTIMKAITKVAWTGYATVTGVVMHPTDWETVRLMKGATNQDYVVGSPLIDVQPRLWGIPVVVTNAITQGTGLVGDFASFVEIRRKKVVTVELSNSNGTDFVENKLMLRCEMREALPIYRGSAFCKATGLSP